MASATGQNHVHSKLLFLNLLFYFYFSEVNFQVAEGLWRGFSRDWGRDGVYINWNMIVLILKQGRGMLDLNLYSKCCFLSAFLQDLSLLRGYEAEQGNSFTCKSIRFCFFAYRYQNSVSVFPRALTCVACSEWQSRSDWPRAWLVNYSTKMKLANISKAVRSIWKLHWIN